MPPGMVRGLAHITGGGLVDNLPRVLPENCDALIETRSWRVPPIFDFLERQGKIDRTEMYQVFNMGIGMVAIVSENDSAKAGRMLKAKRIGTIVRGKGKTRLVL
jgi:phosphoribosylformylglycinamidine cyclo-ligase